MKQATKIIAQKTTANEELAKDVVKANQALVNFNHLFDKKNKEVRYSVLNWRIVFLTFMYFR